MKIKLLMLDLLIALYVTGCGSASDANQTHAAGPTAAPGAPGEIAPSQTTGEPPSHLQSFAVDDQKALPTCDATSEAEIAYVTADKDLVACQDGSWVKIDLEASEVSPVAEAAVTPEPSPSPTPVALAPNEFLEQESGLVWTKNPAPVVFDDAKAVCSSIDRRLPTEKEITAATVLGTLGKPALNGIGAWADSGKEALIGGGGGTAAHVMIDVEPTDKGYVYCVKNP